MNQVFAIFKKEFRGYFASPIALVFLTLFLVGSLLLFFSYEGFFGRNLADVRPLFKWLPWVLAVLSSALTMRLWSEEEKLGTQEMLFTLPVSMGRLVAGKFLAALSLIALCLALTLSVPVTVSQLGALDWGPVIGGYLAVLLLAAAYVALGLWISALVSDQITAFLVTMIVLVGLLVIGMGWVAIYFGTEIAETVYAFSTLTRFESILRGVLDLRDLVYYASFIGVFLTLNVLTLKAKGWSAGGMTAGIRREARSWAYLVLANAILLNLIIAPFSQIRIDMTSQGEYSISPVTEELTQGLSETLLIRGYISNKTHPLLAPLVPRIRDTIDEYAAISNGKVKAEFFDPREDEEIEKEAQQAFSIKSFPFSVSDGRDDSVVNSYFSILVKYGDQFEVLNFGDLIEVQPGTGNPPSIEVKLRNLEYDLTRAIKKVAYGFQTLDAVLSGLSEKAEFFVFVTPEKLPESAREVPARIEEALAEIKGEAKGAFEYKIVNPDEQGALESRESLARKYGFRPAPVFFGGEPFYLHLLLKVGDRYERIMPDLAMTKVDIKKEIVSSLKRSTPGFLKTVGLVAIKPEAPQLPPQFAQQRPPPQMPDTSQMLSQKLAETFQVETLDLKNGRVPGNIDVLMVYAPRDFDEAQQFAIDQFIMRGGTVVVFASKYELDPQSRDGIGVKKVNTGLELLLGQYGITLEDALVLDTQNEPFPIPVVRDLGGLKIREMQQVKYPFFVDIRGDGLSDETPVTGGLPSVTMQWASPLKYPEGPVEGDNGASKIQYTPLLKSSANAWTQTTTNVNPDFQAFPESGFEVGDAAGPQTLAILARGEFVSFFKGKSAPGAETDKEKQSNQVLESSAGEARIAVFGSASCVNDMVLGLARQSRSGSFVSNLQLVQNVVDWGLEDTSLLSIRARGAVARTLRPLDSGAKLGYELANYGFALGASFIIALVAFTRRRNRKPLPIRGQGSRTERPSDGSMSTPMEVRSS